MRPIHKTLSVTIATCAIYDVYITWNTPFLIPVILTIVLFALFVIVTYLFEENENASD